MHGCGDPQQPHGFQAFNTKPHTTLSVRPQWCPAWPFGEHFNDPCPNSSTPLLAVSESLDAQHSLIFVNLTCHVESLPLTLIVSATAFDALYDNGDWLIEAG